MKSWRRASLVLEGAAWLLDDIEASVHEPDVDGARRVAVQGRARGLAFVHKNEWRRAEAVFSRALGALEENLDLLKVEDRRDIESEVVAPAALGHRGVRAAPPGF